MGWFKLNFDLLDQGNHDPLGVGCSIRERLYWSKILELVMTWTYPMLGDDHSKL